VTLALCDKIKDSFYVFFGKDFNVIQHLRNAETHLTSDASIADAERYQQKVKELTLNIEEKASDFNYFGKNSFNLIGNELDPAW
jgi:hypothetical protein